MVLVGLLHELHGHVVHDAVIYLLKVVLVVLCDLEEYIPEKTIGLFHYVCLVDHGNVLTAHLLRLLEGKATDALGSAASNELDRFASIVAEPVLDAGVEVLGVLAEGDNIHVLERKVYSWKALAWPDIRVQVQFRSQGYIHRAEAFSYRCCQWSL